MVDGHSNFNSALEETLLELEQLVMARLLLTEQDKVISILASGQDLIAVLKKGVGRPTWLLLNAKMLLVLIHFFCGW